MNSIAIPTTNVKPMSVVQPRTPFIVGILAAKEGELCLPELIYPRKDQQQEYAQGFETVAGPTLLSGQILGRPNAYEVGQRHYAEGVYAPADIYAADYVNYVQGWNDAWASATGHTLSR